MSTAAISKDTRLDELASIVNDEHAQVEKALRSALGHALKAGGALYEAKATVGRKGWPAWLEANVTISSVAANRYLRVYQFRDQIPAEVTTLNNAIAFLQEHELRVMEHRLTASQIEHALVRTDAGEPAADVAADLGTTREVVYLHRTKRNKRQRREREIHRQVKRALRPGTAAAELYAMAERMQDVLAQAQREATTSHARAAFDEAGLHYRKMRDEIVRAALAGGNS